MNRRASVLTWVVIIVALVAVVIVGIRLATNRSNAKHAVGTSNIPSSNAPVIVHIKIVNNPKTGGAFVPAEIRVIGNRNESIQVTNDSNAVHTVTDKHGAFNTGNIPRGHSVTFRITAPRLYHYYDIHHPSMTGTINVILRRERRPHP